MDNWILYNLQPFIQVIEFLSDILSNIFFVEPKLPLALENIHINAHPIPHIQNQSSNNWKKKWKKNQH